MRKVAAHKRNTRLRRGFTLIEVLIAVGLAVLVIGLLLIPLTGAMGYFRSASARSDAQTVARNALDMMARELSEAAYVQQDMNSNDMVAFCPPLHVNPDDPTSQVVTPPRPDWDHMVRYWRALHDPESNYTPASRLGQPNTYFLARTVVDYPFKTDDPWNRWNDDWEGVANKQEPGVHYAAMSRVVHSDVEVLPSATGDPIIGTRNLTEQPGYPFLEAKWRYADPVMAGRYYRDRVKPLTPDTADYDVQALSFQPMVVSGEWLSPALGAEAQDKSVYLARYPLWRLGVPYTSWSALQGENPIFGPKENPVPAWARDPFLLIYRYDLTALRYSLIGIGCFDWRSRTMKVIVPPVPNQLTPAAVIYDTYQYPMRPLPTLPTPATSIAFDVDWINGSLRFDFPPYDAVRNRTVNRPVQISLANTTSKPALYGTHTVNVFDYPLTPWWQSRAATAPLTEFLLPDTVSVKLSTTVGTTATPGRALRRVSRTPRDFSDEFQVGTNPMSAGTGPEPAYGFIRLPEHLASGVKTNDTTTFLWVYYRWRNNGVMPVAGASAWQEKPDLVCAYYRTGAILDINLTVTRADPSARSEERISQTANMTRRVKLRTATREIREPK